MSDGDYPHAEHYLAAISMTIEAAADNASALAVIGRIIEAGPLCDGKDTWPTRILIDAIHAANGRFEVPDA